eukprot:CAMPEP_0177557600 /NCGR_PEP_ID=MMETSP0369-20130122/69788_1 /TAXON_ID=447022 ORGANISM="Scrippsiella hangoei-like, Strain SHHI-4" /NCGR_SAMPLE_ID=MMETSP0369 /ASSEMBLY_ACC=CAM_ASM_000364 /LENGTH=118 /DNA_ID=CAMNT_0019044071 /DNA_START=213 /DNA_END=566 /DNA_ORIENTATION=+
MSKIEKTWLWEQASIWQASSFTSVKVKTTLSDDTYQLTDALALMIGLNRGPWHRNLCRRCGFNPEGAPEHSETLVGVARTPSNKRHSKGSNKQRRSVGAFCLDLVRAMIAKNDVNIDA